MQKRKQYLGLAAVILTALFLVSGCGGASTTSSGSGGGGGGDSGVGIDGRVQAPSESSSLNSLPNISKGIANEEGIVAKAIVDAPVSGGSVTAKLLDGMKLDDGIISPSGSIIGLVVDPAKLDSTKQVLLECTVGGKKFTNLVDLTGKSAGETVNSGVTNSDTTLSVQQVFFQASSNATPENPAALAAKIASGEIQPLALFQTFKNVFGVSNTAGSGDAASSYQAMSKAFKAAMANGAPSFSDINTALAGGGILNTWKGLDSSLSGVDMSTAAGHIQNYIPAVAKTFEDSSTFTKYFNAGNTGWAACAQYFGKQTGSELLNGFNQPAVFRGYLGENADAFNAGDNAAFDAMKKAGAARVMGELAGKFSGTAFSGGQYAALKKLIDSQSSGFDTLDSGKFAAMGEAFFNQIRAANTTAEIDLIKANPSTFAGKIFDNPGAYVGSGGSGIFDGHFTTFKLNPTGFGGSGCNVDADCTGGLKCSPYKFCIASCDSNCAAGSSCSTGGQCSSGVCNAGVCHFASTVDPFTLAALRPNGSTCTANGECMSGICTSSVCSAPAMANSVAHAGYYRKTSGQSPTCNIAFQIDGISGGMVFFNVQPADTNNPQLNTFYGGGINLVGTSSPFSIAAGNIGNNSGSTGTIDCSALTLSATRLTGTCTLTTSSGTPFPSSCTIDHTEL